MNEKFRVLANGIAHWVGTPSAFAIAVIGIIIWAVTGPMFAFSDTWQLIINTSTTIITFLMVFLIQNTQNRDARAIHLKLDELIHATKGARNHLIDLERLSDTELDKLHAEFCEIQRQTGQVLGELQAVKRPSIIRLERLIVRPAASHRGFTLRDLVVPSFK